MTTLLNSMLNAIRISDSNLAIYDIQEGSSSILENKSPYGFLLVLRGSCSIEGLGGDSLLQMTVGDYVFFLREREINLLQDTDIGPQQILGPVPESSDAVPNIRLGTRNVGLSILGGSLEFEPVIGPFLKLLPDWLVLNSQTRRQRFGKTQSTFLREALNRKGSSVFLNRLVELYLIELIRNSTADVHWMDRASMTTRELSNILATVQMMATGLGQKWSVANLARHANMSRSAFAIAFHETIGKPPLQFLTELRMQRAAALLRQESTILKQLSYEVGYDSELAFSRAFRKFFGVTPSMFRKNIQHKDPHYSEDMDHWSDFFSN